MKRRASAILFSQSVDTSRRESDKGAARTTNTKQRAGAIGRGDTRARVCEGDGVEPRKTRMTRIKKQWKNSFSPSVKSVVKKTPRLGGEPRMTRMTASGFNGMAPVEGARHSPQHVHRSTAGTSTIHFPSAVRGDLIWMMPLLRSLVLDAGSRATTMSRLRRYSPSENGVISGSCFGELSLSCAHPAPCHLKRT